MLTRRQAVCGASALAGLAWTLPLSACAAPSPFNVRLPIPPLIDARTRNNAIALVAQQTKHAFRAGSPVAALGYSGSLLGPTLRFRRGDTISVSIRNEIGVPTILHWHGVLIPSVQDGAPHDRIEPGGVWRRDLQIDQSESTAWYHPHTYGDTARQVYAGLAGLVFIEDNAGEGLGLPHDYGIDDIPLVLQDRLFDGGIAPIYPVGRQTAMLGARGDTIIVNGAIAPVARVPHGIIRFRCLNGSNARNLELGFDDGRSFHVIASDGGYLSSPQSLDRLWIAPGERYEILIDCSDGHGAVLTTGADDGAMMGMMGGEASPALAIMRVAPDPTLPARVRALPSRLADIPTPRVSPNLVRRRFVLNDMSAMMGGRMMGGMMRAGGGALFAINGRSFDMSRIDAAVSLGASEVWEVATEAMAHPFHIHGVHFRVLSLGGAEPPPHLSGWKDTVLVRQSAQLLVPFTRPAPPEHPFMFHCHILEHEDAGMMGQFTIAA